MPSAAFVARNGRHATVVVGEGKRVVILRGALGVEYLAEGVRDVALASKKLR